MWSKRARHRSTAGTTTHSSEIGDARDLPHADSTADAVLLLVRSIISSKGKTGSPACAKLTAFCAREA